MPPKDLKNLPPWALWDKTCRWMDGTVVWSTHKSSWEISSVYEIKSLHSKSKGQQKDGAENLVVKVLRSKYEHAHIN
jgi:hypothetical protein